MEPPWGLEEAVALCHHNPDKPEKSKQIRNSNSKKVIMGLVRICGTSGGNLLDTDHCWLCFEFIFCHKNTEFRTKGLKL